MEICFVCTAKSWVIVLYFFVVHLAITAILLYINGIYSYPPWQKYCRFNCCLYYHSVILYLDTSRCHKLNIWNNVEIVLGITEIFIFIVFGAILPNTRLFPQSILQKVYAIRYSVGKMLNRCQSVYVFCRNQCFFLWMFMYILELKV